MATKGGGGLSSFAGWSEDGGVDMQQQDNGQQRLANCLTTSLGEG
jgi:hypothetical protein